MFHVSNLKKCYADDEPLAVLLDGLHLDDKLHFVEEPVEIVGRKVKRLKQSQILLVKVRWNSKRGHEFTWEREDQFKKKYPHLFTKNKMAEENILAPTRSYDQLVPIKTRLPYGKSNLLLDLQKLQKNLDAKSGVYSFQLDEQWFTLNADLLSNALEITSVDSAHPFVSHPVGEQVMDFVNELGYPKEIHFVSKIHVNNLYQPWRAILTLINQCLIDKTSGNLKFVPKGEKDEVFGKPIPQKLITKAVQNLEYYQKYLEMAARKPTTKEGRKKKTTSKLAPAKQTKHVKEKTTKPFPTKKVRKGKVAKIHKGKSSLQLVDKDEEVQHEPEPQVKDEEYDIHKGIQMSLESFLPLVGGVAIREPTSVTEEASTRPSAQHEDDTSANVIHDTPSPADAKIGADKEKSYMTLEERTVELDESQVGSDPGNTLESRPPPDKDQAGSDPEQSHVALAGPNSEAMHEDFIATVYPKVHESLKYTTEEHIFLENPPSSFETLSSMESLDDAFTFVTIHIHQASSSVPPLSVPVIDLSPLKPVSSSIQAPTITTKTETTTTTLPLPPPPSQQSTIDPKLAFCVSALEKRSADLEQKTLNQDKTIQALSFRVYTQENHDLYSKIDKQVNEVVKEAVHDTLQALLLDRFRELEEFIEEQTKSHSEDTGTGHLSKIKTRLDWLKLVPKEDRPETPEPNWVIHLNDLPEAENNWTDALAKTYKNPEENKLLRKTRDIGSFIKWYCRQIGKLKLSKADLEGPTFKLFRPFYNNSISFQFQMEECHLLLIDQIDLVNPKGDKERRNAILISKLKATYYPDFGLEEFVPSLWIESECEYDISTAYGISHWWFKHKEFYITRHSAPSNLRAVRSHMKILSVVSLKTFSRYGYTFLKEIVLRRADYKEYKILKADFKNLHLNDFEDLYLVHLQGKLNHLSGANKVHLFNADNLWIRNIVIRKHVED
ncbi:hypothetical protein Tco_0776656 [Tanacetum coccineum]